jgi:positive regulator of sigma E activity
MTKSFMRLIVLAFLGTGLVPLVTVTCSWLNVGVPLSSGFLFKLGCSVSAVLLATAGFYVLLRKFQSRLDANAREQEDFLSALAPQYVDLAILSAAALSLFLELALIRWQGTVFEFFAFYKNFSLLCCFAGLGLGYALADRHRIPLGLTIPLLGWQFGLMIVLRFSMPMWRLQSLRILRNLAVLLEKAVFPAAGNGLRNGGPCHSGLAGESFVEEHLFPVPATGIVSGPARPDGDSRGWALLPKGA